MNANPDLSLPSCQADRAAPSYYRFRIERSGGRFNRSTWTVPIWPYADDGRLITADGRKVADLGQARRINGVDYSHLWEANFAQWRPAELVILRTLTALPDREPAALLWARLRGALERVAAAACDAEAIGSALIEGGMR